MISLLKRKKKMLTNNNSAKLGKVLGNFDFVKTQALMLDLDWDWGFNGGVPSISEMVDMAHSLLTKAINGNGYCASGGFEATFENGVFALKFVTEESNDADAFVFTPNLETVSCGCDGLECEDN